MQVFLNGTISGLTLALLALAFMVVYLPCRVFYLALAGIYALVPYIALVCLGHGWPMWLAMVAAIAAGVVVSVLCELFNHSPLERKHASPGAHLIASLGLYMILVQVVAIIWGNETQVIRTGVDETLHIRDVVLTRGQLISGGGAAVVIAGFYFWLRSSNIGLRFRALADNPTQLALYGYNTDRLRLLAFALCGLLASAASLMTAYDVGFGPHDGLQAVLLAIVAVIVGGRGSFLAPVLGGVVLGVLRSQVVWYSSARWQEPATFALLVIFLLFRPHGILGKKSRLEAED